MKNYSPSYPSDRNIKENLSPVSGKEVLDRLDSIPISTWNYKTQDAAARHMGPMAQDFYAAFGLGDDEHSISVVDANGVSLAAIQGLYRLLQEKDAQIVSQQRQIAELETRITALEATTSSKTTSSQPWQSALLLGAVLPIGLGLAWVARRRRG
jgi:hypothetical protein